VPAYRQSLGEATNSLAIFLATRGRAGEAEPYFREVIPIRRRLAADDPTVVLYAMSLASALMNHGASLYSTGRPAEAEPEYRESAALYRRLISAAPEVTRYRSLSHVWGDSP
jgi:Flp pilus assembly protein TadD